MGGSEMTPWQRYKFEEHTRLHARLREQFPDYEERHARMLREGLMLGQAFPGAFPEAFGPSPVKRTGLPLARHHRPGEGDDLS